jgi:hypothetical protein
MSLNAGDNSEFCSETCALDQIGQDLLHPDESDPVKSQRARNAASFIEICSENGNISPILSAKFLARMIQEEQTKQVENMSEYSLWDHMDMFHYIDLEVFFLPR